MTEPRKGTQAARLLALLRQGHTCHFVIDQWICGRQEFQRQTANRLINTGLATTQWAPLREGGKPVSQLILKGNEEQQ